MSVLHTYVSKGLKLLTRLQYSRLLCYSYSGPQRGEWCQTNQIRFDVVENGPAAEARALIANDVCFYTSTGREVDIDGPFESVAYATVEWKWQKNQDNGEIVKYFVNDKCLSWCPVHALWRIKLRARRLNVQPHEPLAKYRNDRGRVAFLTDSNVNSFQPMGGHDHPSPI